MGHGNLRSSAVLRDVPIKPDRMSELREVGLEEAVCKRAGKRVAGFRTHTRNSLYARCDLLHYAIKQDRCYHQIPFAADVQATGQWEKNHVGKFLYDS